MATLRLKFKVPRSGLHFYNNWLPLDLSSVMGLMVGLRTKIMKTGS